MNGDVSGGVTTSPTTISRVADLWDAEHRYFSPTLARYTSVMIDRAEGPYVWEADGTRYLDFAMGIATVNTGHRHPKVIEAVKAQLDRYVHLSASVVHYPENIRLAEELATITPGDLDVSFFANSGAEAVEASLKLARYVTGRKGIIAFQGGFHGRTYGALSVTSSKVHYREGYEPFVPGVHLLPFPYALRCPHGCASDEECADRCIAIMEAQFEQVIDPYSVASMLVEPVQGEGGYIVPPAAFLQRLRQLCNRYGILLLADEVQSGFGRTGTWFASEHFGVVPDVQIMAKGIASGFPLSAISARREVMDRWPAGAHGTTFGGNPVSCVASLATIAAIREEGMLANADRQGERLRAGLTRLKRDCERIVAVRGLGLMNAIEFSTPSGAPDGDLCEKVRAASLERGLLLLTCGHHDQALRLIPPLNISKEQIDEALDIIAEAIKVGLAAPA